MYLLFKLYHNTNTLTKRFVYKLKMKEKLPKSDFFFENDYVNFHHPDFPAIKKFKKKNFELRCIFL